MSRLLIWPVTGMHCLACERLIAEELREVEGVEEVEVSLARKRAGIRLRADAAVPSRAALNRRLQAHGYTLLAPTLNTAAEDARPSLKQEAGPVCVLPTTAASRSIRLLRAGMAIGGMLLIARFVWPLIATLVPTVTAQASLIALFGFGVVASLSTCLASTGAFFLAYTSGRTDRRALGWLHLGRLGAFVLGGAILGGIGQLWHTSASISGLMGLGLGLGFLLVALHLLELSPSLASLGFHLPRSWQNLFEHRITSHGSRASFVVGMATFLLPCGFTQTAQALALASGSAVRGAFLLGAFALGTLPTLLGVSFFGSAAALQQRSFRLASGALLFLFALGQTDGALTVLGSPITLGGLTTRAWTSVLANVLPQPVEAQEQLVRMTVARGAFSPNRFVVRRGVPVRWEVNGVDLAGCASTLVVPTLGVRRDLFLGQNTILFTPKEKGEIPFSCSLGMIRGSFTVVE